ncbi:hypothetical protein CF327_g5043 [Tilletia walkeri]|uniref:Mid2 domain-containing protein n=1 Tax=Tilletia walkeri TaxID=117179 RepID=A0A8X7T4E0_9BASI|nr:hypothetical protein CF327_g5043 [Tilletia walkeri]KAE8268452.1 hypothetical protein A4X09_0g3884 [Tilletia walkeri]
MTPLTLLLAAVAASSSTAAPTTSLHPRQGALAGINDVLSDTGKAALNKAQHRTAGLTTLQLSILVAGILLALALGCFGLWYCCGARAKRRHAREDAAAAKENAGNEPWMRFNHNGSVDSTTELTKA